MIRKLCISAVQGRWNYILEYSQLIWTRYLDDDSCFSSIELGKTTWSVGKRPPEIDEVPIIDELPLFPIHMGK